MTELIIPESVINKFGQKTGLGGRVRELFLGDYDFPEDIYDQTQEISVYTKDKPTSKERKFLSHLVKFCQETSADFREEFYDLIEEYKESGRRVSDTMLEKLSELKLDVPKFEIFVGKARNELLENLQVNESYQFQENSIVVLFNLPKPLSQYWWKGGAESWGSAGLNVDAMVMEWGHFYRELMPVIWNAIGREECNEDYRFYRINSVGQHEPQAYYYIWEVVNTRE